MSQRLMNFAFKFVIFGSCWCTLQRIVFCSVSPAGSHVVRSLLLTASRRPVVSYD